MSWYFWRGFKNFFGMKAISRTILSFWSVCVAACILPSCSIDDEEDLVGNWVKVSDFDGVSRCSAVTFTAGGQVYVATGGYGGYNPNGQMGGCTACDVCNGLICADCCCECMGGDLISCC